MNFRPDLWVYSTVLSLTLLVSQVQGQACKASSAEILIDIQKLNVLGNVLYFGAHPDDENTTFIAYMANDRHYNTAYFSLTRGDGGQNALGTQIRESLGIIRTQELLKARQIDGGQQFFASGVDFGFSKSAEEVFTIWDKEKLLSDAVWVIRKFRPDVIVTRFPPDERAGHGQHIASAVIAEEAFEAAADPRRFPEQLKFLKPWQTKRLVWNAGMWWNQRRDKVDEKDARESVRIDIGGYNHILGKSYGEIAAESRSQHRSQAFGTAGFRGSLTEYFTPVKGEKATGDLFSGINTQWSRVKGTTKIQSLITKLVREPNSTLPEAIVPTLLAIRSELSKLPEGYWKTVKLKETDQLIIKALGLSAIVTSGRDAYSPGQPMQLSAELINRSKIPVTLKKVLWPFHSTDSLVHIDLSDNHKIELKSTVAIPTLTPYSQPYWLKNQGTAGNFAIEEQTQIGMADNRPAAEVEIGIQINGQSIAYTLPVWFLKTDPIQGEKCQPLAITPPVYLKLDQKVYLFNGQEGKKVSVNVANACDQLSGQLRLKVPSGWKVQPAFFNVDLKGKASEQNFVFDLLSPAFSDNAEIGAELVSNGQVYDRSLDLISYTHIPEQKNFPLAKARIVRTEINKSGNLIGYLQGAGDLVPASIQEMGYQVVQLKEDEITIEKLQTLDAVVVGVRAYNIIQRMNVINPLLLQYVERGGNLIVQYNSDQGLLMDNIGPYPFKISAKRVTVENSEVRFLDSQCQVLNHPNKITKADFEGWVQERSLYQPELWSEQYQTVISCNDPGNEELKSGILIAKYGKGNYIYTTLSWFRQLPAGVPGAYRLFANLISLGH